VERGLAASATGDAIVFDDLGADPAATETPRRAPGTVSIYLIVILLMVGTVGSFLAANSWRSAVQTEDQRAFDTSATGIADTLNMALQRDADVLATARTLVATNPSIDSNTFGQWFGSLDTVRRYPGSFAFAYIRSVSPAQLPEFIATTNADPPGGLTTAGGFQLNPPGVRSQYCLIRLVTVQIPVGGKVTLVGLERLRDQFASYLDPGTDECSGWQNSLLQASASSDRLIVGSFGEVLSSVQIKDQTTRALVAQIVGNLSPIEMVEPVYAIPANTPLGTRPPPPQLLGWVGGIFDSNDLLAPIASQQSDTSYVLAYRGAHGKSVVVSQVGRAAPGSVTRTYSLSAEGSWSLTLTGPLRGGLSPNQQGLVVLLVGLALTLLFFLLFKALSNSRKVALAMVTEKTGELRHLALHDSLTGLPNRTLIMQRTTEALDRSRRSGQPLAVFFIDLDGFKDINDANGHGVGDFLLRAVAERFGAALRNADSVGRLGGDEFIVLAEGRSAAQPERLAARLLAACVDPIHIGTLPGVALPVAASIGIATGVRDSAEELLRDADIALYQAKANGKGRYVIFEQEMHTAVRSRIELDAELRTATTHHQFFLLYQPIFDLATLEITGVEALVRWQHPTRGMVAPFEFIPTLEESGLIVEVGQYVLDEACRQARRWHDLGFPLRMSVNVSAGQLELERIVTDVRHALSSSGLDPGSLVVEITETGLMHDADGAARRLRELKRLGVYVAIDDFGTGYSSLAYLQQFPADVLKIDGSFIAAMAESAEGTALVHAMVQLGNALGLETLAEGIEHQEQLRLLRIEACGFGQGYLFAVPMSASEVEVLLRTGPVEEPATSGRISAETVVAAEPVAAGDNGAGDNGAGGATGNGAGTGAGAAEGTAAPGGSIRG
jgi:diguanylate cyclase (GGDEF)-like protein